MMQGDFAIAEFEAPDQPGVRALRRQGIATALLQRLMDYAADNGYGTVVLEATASWSNAVAFYERRGFVALREKDGDRHFEKRIA